MLQSRIDDAEARCRAAVEEAERAREQASFPEESFVQHHVAETEAIQAIEEMQRAVEVAEGEASRLREQLSGSCAVPNSYSSQWPSGWSTQPNCKKFGINLDDNYRAARFGFQANQENNCDSHDTAAGLGIGPLGHDDNAERRGAGDMCRSSGCSHGNTNNGYQGILWGRVNSLQSTCAGLPNGPAELG